MHKEKKDSIWSSWGILGAIIGGGAAFATVVPILRRRGMRATTILRKDHRLASALLAALARTPRINGVVRRSLVDQIYGSVMAHERAEDEVLYPAIRNRGFVESGPEIEDAYFEQNTIKDLADRLAEADPMSDAFDERLGEFRRTLGQHAEREERYVFKLVETQMSTTEQEELGERLRSMKKDLKRRPRAA